MFQNAALGSGGRIIFKTVNVLIISISIKKTFIKNSVTAYTQAKVCCFKLDQFKLLTTFLEILQARMFGSTI